METININHTLDTRPEIHQVNSFIRGKLLFQTVFTNEYLQVQITDWTQQKLLQQFKTLADEEITYKNTPMMQRGGQTGLTRNVARDLDDTRKFLKKALSANVAILCDVTSDNRLQVRLGAYERIETSTYSPTGVTFSASWDYYVFFDMVLDAATLNHLPGEQVVDMEDDRLERYFDTTELKYVPTGYSIWFSDRMYFFYCKKDRLHIVQF